MKTPRSRNLNLKPSARNWIITNTERSALLLEVIQNLEASYCGAFSGFVDFAPAQYRFNDTKSGGYILLDGREDGSVKARVQLKPDKWAEQRLVSSDDISTLVGLITKHHIHGFDFESARNQAEFERAIEASLADLESERKRRLKNANPKPKKVWRKVAVYIRNPDVVAEVLLRSKGNCEKCGNCAPFFKRTDKSPYLEVHHRQQLADGGNDTVENAIALCPNCHRREHHG